LPFTYFLALRYLKPKRTFLSLITLISILGVVLGISVLIIVISVMTGFERELQRKIIGFDADVLISGNEVMNNWREILDHTKKTPGVVAAAPFAQGRVIVQFQNHRAVPWLRGIDPELGFADCEPSPRNAALVESILPRLADEAGIDWAKSVGEWSQEEMIGFLMTALRIIEGLERG